jgi:opacity protein-like surface antigen
MHRRELVAVALMLGTAALPAWGQATQDQARLVFTVSGGVVVGRHLWSVDNQPAQFTTPADTFAIGRRIRSTIVIGFGGTYFPHEHLGLSVEGFLIGLGFEDSCRLVFPSGSGDAATTCQSIQGATKSATAVTLSGGPVFRINSNRLISPYARANVGLVFSNQSSLRTIGRYPTSGGLAERTVFADDHDSRIAPSLALGAGFTAAVAKGYQLRWEIRDNIVGVQRVTGSTPQSDLVPPHKLTYKHLFSMTIGFDVVLERRRGRRY